MRATRPAVLEFRELEPRIAFDAAFGAAVVDVLSDAPSDLHEGLGDQSGAIDGHFSDAAHPAQPPDEIGDIAQASQIVFIDSRVEDAADLVAAIDPSADIVFLDPDRDGVEQIAEALASRNDVEAIHILAHGSAGQLMLGNGEVNAETINGFYAGRLAEIGASLSADADILIYGCDFGAGQQGLAAVSALAGATGADIAASDDLTGHSSVGGDWDLEVEVGKIEAQLAILEGEVSNWHHTLDAIQAVNSSSAEATGTDTLTYSHTVGDDPNRILLVSVAVRTDVAVSSITYGGTPLSLVASEVDDTGKVRIEMWSLLSPAVGTDDVVVTMTGNANFTSGATDFANVDQATPFGSVTQATGKGDPSFVVSSAAGELVVDAVADRDVDTELVGGGQSVLWTTKNGAGSNDSWGGSSTEAGSASTTMSWTTQGAGAGEWAAVALSLKQETNSPPVITSDGGGATASVSVDEGSTAVTTVTATDSDPGDTLSYSIVGGADAGLFAIDAGTGALSFLAAPDFESPADAGGDNVYDVRVQVSDGDSTESQDIAVTVTNVSEPVPGVSIPTAQAGAEDAPIVFSSANGNAIVLDEVAGLTTSNAIVIISVPAQSGTLVLGGTDGLISVSGDGTNEIRIVGSVSDINSALDGMAFVPASDWNGSANLVVNVTRPTTSGFLNSGFEQPDFADTDGYHYVDDASVPGWDSSASNDIIEIQDSGHAGTPAFEGDQFVELNASEPSTLSQTFTPDGAGGSLVLTFAHRGRLGVDTMNVTAIDLGANGVLGGGDDVVLLDQDYTTSNTDWVQYAADLGVASGNKILLSFASVSASGGNPDYGNFLDAVSIFDSAQYSADSIGLSVTPVTDGVADAISTTEDTPVTFNVLTGNNGASADNFENPDRLLTAVTQPANGQVVFASDGTVTYTPDANFTGVDSFTYTVESPSGVTETVDVTMTITNTNDDPVGIPVITGTATEDQTLTADTSGISDADGLGTFSYQWYRDTGAGPVAITGATASTYTLGDDDVDAAISVAVSYVDGHGTSEGPLVSAPTSPVVNVNDDPVGLPVVSGTETEDQTLTADTSGISDADGLGLFSYQWYRNTGSGPVAVPGATASTYTLGDDDVNALMSVAVAYIDSRGASEGPLVSAATSPVVNVNDDPVIVSNGAGPAATLSVEENQTFVTDVVSTDVDGGPAQYSISGGADAARFRIDAATGELRFVIPPNYEGPDDANRDRIYEVQVRVSDGFGGFDVQQLVIVVTDVSGDNGHGDGGPSTPGGPDGPGPDPERDLDTVAGSQIADEPKQSVSVFNPDRGKGRDEASEKTDDEPDQGSAEADDGAALRALDVPFRLSQPGDIFEGLPDEFAPPTPGNADEVRLDLKEVDESALWQTLDQVASDLQDDTRFLGLELRKLSIGGSAALTAGFVAWALRGGMLASSLLTALPALQRFDPILVVVARKRGKETPNRGSDSRIDNLFDVSPNSAMKGV